MYIETWRMIIRDFTQEDAADLHEIFGDDETMKNCEPAYDFKKTKEFLTSFFWRQGYAYESCKSVIDYAFTEMKAHKVFVEAIDTVKSVGLMQKLGMLLEGIQRSQTKNLNGNWVDLYIYGLLEDDWRKHENQV